MVEPSPRRAAPGDPERLIPLEQVRNFRDVGGYPTAGGRRVRWRRLFRSGSLSQPSPADLETLRVLGIATVVDLRSTAEWDLGRFPVAELPVQLHHLPIVEDIIDPTRLGLPEGMLVDRYRQYARQGAGPIARTISILADPVHHPVVVHCLAGKDRTGVLIAIVLGLLGVDDATVAEDYALSEAAMAELRAEAEANPRIPTMSRAAADEVFSARPAAIAGLLADLRREHGSLEGYARWIGTTPDVLEDLRAALTE
jgi:protein-tyrosine phosphatase